VSPLLTGAPARVTPAVLRKATASAEALAAQQREYAAADASIAPESFRVPNLHSPEARRAAREHGIHINRWIARHS
jgi:pyruvate/2-oxoglutarate dehydrogenase complex dihydrolipoamide acyltransferase (E2) component